MLIVEGDEVLFELDKVDEEPYGITVVNSMGGVSLSAALRSALSAFFKDGVSPTPAPQKPINVVSFPIRDYSIKKND